MIKANSLGFTYPGCPTPAIKCLSFTANKGELIGLVGGSGSGKSTLLKVLAGLAPGLVRGQRFGELTIDQVDPGHCSAAQRVKLAGLLFSQPASQLSAICPTVEEEIAWGLGNIGVPTSEIRAQVEEVCCRLNLTELRKRNPFSLSTGQQQRVAIAAIVALSPKVFLWDDPVAALDPAGRQEIISLAKALAEQGHLVIWGTAHLEEVAVFPRWLALNDGQITYDGAPRLPLNCEALEAAWTRLAQQCRPKTAAAPANWPVTEEQTLEYLRLLQAAP